MAPYSLPQREQRTLPIGSATFGPICSPVEPTHVQVARSSPRLARLLGWLMAVKHDAAWEARWRVRERREQRWARWLHRSIGDPPGYV